MKVRYQIFKRLNLEVHQFSGNWSTAIFEEFLEKLKSEPDFVFVKKILVDLRKVNLKPAVPELDLIVNFRKNTDQKNHAIVHIVDSPSGTAVSHLYQEMLNQSGFTYEYCSTIDFALKILDLDITSNQMEELLTNSSKNLIEFKSNHENKNNPAFSLVQH